MRTTIICLLTGLLALAPAAFCVGPKGDEKVESVLIYKMKGIDGKEVDLSKYQGKVVLIVNVASQCGFTPQYEGLQKIYEKFKDKDFVVLGVPANEFGAQEPGSDEEIAKFCTTNYKVTFPMLSKVVVNGDGITPLYEHLTSKEKDPKFSGPIKWNFTKFLIGRDGKVAGRFDPDVTPESEELTGAVETELNKKK